MALTALLEKNATAKKPAAKKSSAPSLDAPAEVKAAVDAFNKAKVAEKNAKAEMALHGEKIMSHVRPLADADGFKGSFKNSYDVPGNDGKVKVVYANKFSINPEDKNLIADILGAKFAELIKEKFVVTLKQEVLEDEEKSAELERLMGEKFAEFFDVTKSLVVASDFDEKVYGAVNRDELADLRNFVKQAKPSLR
jgi:hypothetical protein